MSFEGSGAPVWGVDRLRTATDAAGSLCGRGTLIPMRLLSMSALTDYGA
jgi:hypothetical protein